MNLSKNQHSFLFNNDSDVLLSGGYGSGKTYIGARKAFRKLMQDTSCLGFIGANTYKSLHQIVLKEFTGFLRQLGIEYVYGSRPKWWRSPYDSHDGILSLRPGGQVACWSLDNPSSYDGLTIGWYWIDETKDTSKEAFDILQARRRAKHETGTQGIVTTIPDGTDQWLYDYYITGNRKVIYLSTEDNKNNLEQGYIDRIKAQYDEKLLAEKLHGRFIVKNAGQVYYAFTDANIKEIPMLPIIPLHVGQDFNVSKMCSVVFQYIDSNVIAAVDEVILRNSNTFELAHELKKRYPDHYKAGNIYIYPDASGANRASNASQTDFEILRNNGFKILAKNANPPVRDRLNAVNARFKNGSGQIGCYVSSKCKELITDLKKVKFTHKGEIDKSDIELTHATDAAGYFIYFKFPRII